MNKVYDILNKLKINYKEYITKEVFTCAESTALLPDDMEGIRTKHLFLEDKKTNQYFMIVVCEDKRVDLKLLAKELNVKRLSFVKKERLQEFFNIPYGSLSMMAYCQLKDKDVKLIIDEEIWNKGELDGHANVNNIVLLIECEDWKRILSELNVNYDLISIPSK